MYEVEVLRFLCELCAFAGNFLFFHLKVFHSFELESVEKAVENRFFINLNTYFQTTFSILHIQYAIHYTKS